MRRRFLVLLLVLLLSGQILGAGQLSAAARTEKKQTYSGWHTTETGHKQYWIDGKPHKGFLELKGKTYYFSKGRGYLCHGQKKIDGKYYYSYCSNFSWRFIKIC